VERIVEHPCWLQTRPEADRQAALFTGSGWPKPETILLDLTVSSSPHSLRTEMIRGGRWSERRSVARREPSGVARATYASTIALEPRQAPVASEFRG
jgi:hypothetical protein